MKTIHKNKSRTRLWDALMGSRVLTGLGGRLAVGSIDFGAVAIPTDTVTIGNFVFEFTLAASEAAGTSAGTAAAPHLVAHGANVQATSDNLAAQILAETATTGAWGYLYPDDSVGCVADGTDKVTLTFWPGTWANAVTLVDGCDTAGVLVQPVTASLGRIAPQISVDHAYTLIDSTGGTQNKEYWLLEDGSDVGDTVTVVINGMETNDVPTVVGHLSENGVAMVEVEFITAELGASAKLMWDGAAWEMISYNPLHTVPDFTASA